MIDDCDGIVDCMFGLECEVDDVSGSLAGTRTRESDAARRRFGTSEFGHKEKGGEGKVSDDVDTIGMGGGGGGGKGGKTVDNACCSCICCSCIGCNALNSSIDDCVMVAVDGEEYSCLCDSACLFASILSPFSKCSTCSRFSNDLNV
jgi:hypothetical protein